MPHHDINPPGIRPILGKAQTRTRHLRLSIERPPTPCDGDIRIASRISQRRGKPSLAGLRCTAVRIVRNLSITISKVMVYIWSSVAMLLHEILTGWVSSSCQGRYRAR